MNKKLVCVISILMSLAVNSLAVDFMGPPTADLKQGQLEIGYTFHQSENDILADFGLDDDVEFDNVDITRNYFTFNYGLYTEGDVDIIEVYGFLGAADIESDSYDVFGDEIQFEGNSDFAFGGGLKVTTNHYEHSDWGFLVQASYLQSDDQIAEGTLDIGEDTYSGKVDADFEAVELQAAIGPTFKITKDWKIYGGGFGYFLFGDLDLKASGALSGKASGDLEADSNFGGYIGTQVHLGDHAALAVEFAATGDSTGIGGNISWRF